MMRSRTVRLSVILGLAGLLLATVEGCAHRRQTYYGNDLSPREGVHVRAPFVDVQVNRKPKLEGEPRLSRHDDDDDDDDRD